MNITQIIKEVSKQHTMPKKNGGDSWIVYTTNKSGDVDSYITIGSYKKALRMRNVQMAYDVAVECGTSHDRALDAMYYVQLDGMTINDAVKKVLCE